MSTDPGKADVTGLWTKATPEKREQDIKQVEVQVFKGSEGLQGCFKGNEGLHGNSKSSFGCYDYRRWLVPHCRALTLACDRMLRLAGQEFPRDLAQAWQRLSRTSTRHCPGLEGSSCASGSDNFCAKNLTHNTSGRSGSNQLYRGIGAFVRRTSDSSASLLHTLQ